MNKIEKVILRHPGRLSMEGREYLGRQVGEAFPGSEVIVLWEGVQMWLISDSGEVYDLNRSGTLLDGKFKVVSSSELGAVS